MSVRKECMASRRDRRIRDHNAISPSQHWPPILDSSRASASARWRSMRRPTRAPRPHARAMRARKRAAGLEFNDGSSIKF
jgi:hypothetical protein